MLELKGQADHYGGFIIDAELLPSNISDFAERLEYSLKVWTSQRIRGLWLKLPKRLAAHIPAAIDAGFDFHHAKPGYAMLTRWLPEDAPCTIPDNHMYNVGMGAFVLNSKKEVLLVQEASGILKGKGIWKFPTGLAEGGEDIHLTAEREVFEETGIKTRFDRILAIRQSHGLMFGKSDLFFVCALKPVSEDADQIVIQESELAAADWHQLDAVGDLPIFRSGTLAAVWQACKKYADAEYPGFSVDKLPNEFNQRMDLLMHGPV